MFYNLRRGIRNCLCDILTKMSIDRSFDQFLYASSKLTVESLFSLMQMLGFIDILLVVFFVYYYRCIPFICLHNNNDFINFQRFQCTFFFFGYFAAWRTGFLQNSVDFLPHFFSIEARNVPYCCFHLSDNFLRQYFRWCDG